MADGSEQAPMNPTQNINPHILFSLLESDYHQNHKKKRQYKEDVYHIINGSMVAFKLALQSLLGLQVGDQSFFLGTRAIRLHTPQHPEQGIDAGRQMPEPA